MSHEEIRRGLRALALGGLPAWDGIDDEAVRQLRETCSLVLRERAKERRRLAKEAAGTESERRQRAAHEAMARLMIQRKPDKESALEEEGVAP